jgi:hypothetical protein
MDGLTVDRESNGIVEGEAERRMSLENEMSNQVSTQRIQVKPLRHIQPHRRGCFVVYR